MSTQPHPTPFKTQEELDAFLKRVVVEEVGKGVAEALKPLTEKQVNAMREMLEKAERERQAPARVPGLMLARQARAMALALKETGARDLDAVKSTIKRFWGDDDPVLRAIEDSAKLTALKATASQAQDPTSLGNIIAPQWSAEWIPLLRARALIRSIARVIPNPTGSLTLRRQTAGGVAYWVGEGKAITPSKPGVGLMNFVRKKLAGLTVVSNDLLRYAGPEADQFILDDLTIVMALAEDLALLRGDGTEYSPKGIRSQVAAGNVFAQTGTTLTTIDADFAKALRLIEEANVAIGPEDIHWALVPRTWFALWNAAPATDAGARPYREELKMAVPGANGRILGYAAHKTNQIPKNLGGGSNESETYCLHAPSLWIADTLNLLVDVFPGGAYEDGGVVVSGISRDETVIRVMREMDFNMRHQEAGSIITGVTIA